MTLQTTKNLPSLCFMEELVKQESLNGRFYDLVNGILKKGRQIFVTGCYLRAASGGSGYPRLLPTEYLIILLDEVVKNGLITRTNIASLSYSAVSILLFIVGRGR